MRLPSAVHGKTYLAMLVIVIFAPLGNVLLSVGMKRIGAAATRTPAGLVHVLSQILASEYVWMGIACLLTFFVAYLLVLSWADYSYVQPASSCSYLIVALLGYFFLGEVITPLRWAGVAVICLGVLVVGNTPPRTTEGS